MTSLSSLLLKTCRLILVSGLTCLLALPVWADDAMKKEGSDTKVKPQKMNARDRFYQRYKNKLPSAKKEAEAQRQQMKKRRDERLKQHLEERKMRKEKRGAKAKARAMKGKPDEAAKKEQERIKSRKKEMTDRAKARKESVEKEQQKMREAIKKKARKHREEMKKRLGAEEASRAVDEEIKRNSLAGDQLNQEAGETLRKKDAMKRRQEIIEKRQLSGEKRRQERKLRRSSGTKNKNPDKVIPKKTKEPTVFDQGGGPPDLHISGSDSKIKPPAAPKTMHPDQHISGSGSPAAMERPHVSGTP